MEKRGYAYVCGQQKYQFIGFDYEETKTFPDDWCPLVKDERTVKLAPH